MSEKPKNNSPEYGASSIRVMEGLEAVRKRPAMYIGSTGAQGLHHLVYEVVDNSVDEALAGHCDTIHVKLHPDGSCSVEDNGRGIPTDIHPTEGVSAAEVVLTKLHAGGKFDKESYKFSGGLHGVGISVVNALSKRLDMTIWQKGYTFTESFERGIPLDRLEKGGKTNKRGTLMRFWPDAEIFRETTTFSFDTLSARLRELAFLNRKLRISIDDEINNRSNEFYYEGGIVSFVENINSKKTPITDIVHIEQSDEAYVLEIALQYNDSYAEQVFSFVNNINTVEGGTHVTGFKSALTKVCNKRATDMGILKKGELFSSEDVREGLVCVISIKVPEPQFEGQTKTKLGNNDIKGLVDSWTFSYLDSYFEENPAVARKIFQKAEVAKNAREAAKKARELTRRKTVLESSVLPGKLADCSSEKPAECELFIVEGDSAGGSAKQGRDRHNQAILPLRGKILNVEKARLDKMLSNETIKDLIAAIGAGVGKEECDTTKARYHKIILMTDADVDGSHIRTLLLTFFFRYMTPLIEAGYLYVAQPPLYKAKIGKKEQYLKDDRALKGFLVDWSQEQTTLIVHGKTVSTTELSSLLQALSAYDEQLIRIGNAYKVSQEHAHLLAIALHKKPWKAEDGLDALVNILRQEIPTYTISTTQEEETTADDLAKEARTFVTFSANNKSWRVDNMIFTSGELSRLLALLAPIYYLHENEWQLSVIGKDRMVENRGVLTLMQAIGTLSRPYMTIQRYKGLGEMNAEQLWETSMDSSRRLLLKVTIEDALAADAWFSTLMGDDVAGRKQYIEDYGHFVKHLDI